ncbi:MAG: hypothetical protein Q9220_003503 [cf. Caloplaca sp. 1 TL-2023]
MPPKSKSVAQGPRVKLWERLPAPKFEGRSTQNSFTAAPSINLTSLASAIGDLSDPESSGSDLDTSSGSADLESIADSIAFFERKAAGQKGYELFNGPQSPVKPEESLLESDLTLDQIRQRYLDNLTGRSVIKRGRIWDWEIYAAWQEGPEAIEALRERERRGESARKGRKEGPKTSNPTTGTDLDNLYTDYAAHFTAPAHPFGECKDCKDPLLSRPEPRSLIKGKTNGELSEESEKWHFPSTEPLERAAHAFIKYQRAFKKYTKQQEANDIQILLSTENEERKKQGKPPIPPNETILNCWIRELDEGTHIVPKPSPDKSSESHTEQPPVTEPPKMTTQRIRHLYTLHRAHESKLKSQHASPAQLLHRAAHLPPPNPKCFIFASDSSSPTPAAPKITDFYPHGLAYKGDLVTQLSEIEEGDWERFVGDRVTFEEEMGRTLTAGGDDRENWDKWMEGVLGGYEGGGSGR